MKGAAERHLLAAARHLHSGRPAEAESACRRALGREPDNPDALAMLGTLALRARRHDEAVDLLRRAIGARPQFPDAYNNLGAALEARGQLLKAENAYRAAVRQRPAYPEAWANLGNVLRKAGRPNAAADAHRAALRLKGDCAEALHGLAVALADQGRLEDAVACHRRLVELRPDSAALHSDLLQLLQHDARETQSSLFEEALRWARRHAEPHRRRWGPHDNDPDPARRLRVGYVSPDFRDHPVGRLVHPVLLHHDRSAFEVFCYADFRAPPDALTAGLRGSADTWRDTTGLSDADLADLARGDRVDILVDCAGHFGGNRLPAFARKPAPVQVSHFGYCATTGMAAMDYRLTDAHSDPPGSGAQRYYAEELVYLPDCWWCYRPPEPPPEVGPLPAPSAGHVTFGSLNRLNKVTGPAVDLWSGVLAAVPGSRLLLLSGEADNPHLAARFARRGVDPRRIELTGRLPRPQYLQLHHRIDIGLDPFPYNGDNTMCDGLLMGVPSITLAGDRFASRRGVSHLTNLGLPGLIADTPEDYLAKAVGLARDLDRLASLRAGLRARLLASSPLATPETYVPNLEAAYRTMWRRWCSGRRRRA